MSRPWVLGEGTRDHGSDHRVRDGQWLLAGHNALGRTWYTGQLDGIFGPQMAQAARDAQFDIGYASPSRTYGSTLRAFLLGDRQPADEMKQRAKQRHARKFVRPCRPKGKLIGFPGQGTHSYRYPPNNWESDQGWDIYLPVGSDLLAVASGEIVRGQYGPLNSRDPRMAGSRLHLKTADNEFYYAHASKLIAPEGGKVRQGQVIAKSGEANGVPHLHFTVEKLLPWSVFE